MLDRIDNYQNANFAPEHLKQIINKNTQEEKVNAAKEFEALFVQMSLKEMRPKPSEGGFFNAGQSEQMFYDFMDEAIAKEISKSPSNSFGIADMMLKQGF